jgi:hypothetical protein
LVGGIGVLVGVAVGGIGVLVAVGGIGVLVGVGPPGVLVGGIGVLVAVGGIGVLVAAVVAVPETLWVTVLEVDCAVSPVKSLVTVTLPLLVIVPEVAVTVQVRVRVTITLLKEAIADQLAVAFPAPRLADPPEFATALVQLSPVEKLSVRSTLVV